MYCINVDNKCVVSTVLGQSLFIYQIDAQRAASSAEEGE